MPNDSTTGREGLTHQASNDRAPLHEKIHHAGCNLTNRHADKGANHDVARVVHTRMHPAIGHGRGHHPYRDTDRRLALLTASLKAKADAEWPEGKDVDSGIGTCCPQARRRLPGRVDSVGPCI